MTYLLGIHEDVDEILFGPDPHVLVDVHGPTPVAATSLDGGDPAVTTDRTTLSEAAAEVLVEGDRWRVIRDRETLDDLIRGERT